MSLSLLGLSLMIIGSFSVTAGPEPSKLPGDSPLSVLEIGDFHAMLLGLCRCFSVGQLVGEPLKFSHIG